MAVLGWEISFEFLEGREWEQMKAWLLEQGLVEVLAGAKGPLDDTREMVVTQRGRVVWMALEAARSLETGISRLPMS